MLHVRIEYKCPTAYVQLDAMTTAGLELVSDARGREREKERKNERRERERKKERRAREREKEREREISFGTELSECACVGHEDRSGDVHLVTRLGLMFCVGAECARCSIETRELIRQHQPLRHAHGQAPLMDKHFAAALQPVILHLGLSVRGYGLPHGPTCCIRSVGRQLHGVCTL